MRLTYLIDRALDLFATQPTKTPQINQNVAILPQFDIGKAAPQIFNYKQFGEEGYRKNVVIFASIVAISTSLAQLGYKLYKRKSKTTTKELIEDPDNELLRLLRDPVNSAENPEITGFEFEEYAWTDYEIAGNYVKLITRGGGGDPVRLDLLRPDWVHPIVERDGTIKKYEYRIDGGTDKTDFDARDIIHLKNHPDFTNRWMGLSAIAVMVRQAQLDEQIADFMLGLMLNSGIPGMVLRKKVGYWTADQKDDIRQQIAARVTGKRAGTTFLMDEDWETVETGFTPREMNTDKFITYAEQRICAAIGVMPIILGVAAGVLNMTYDNFNSTKRLWWEDKLIPKSTKSQAKMQQLAENFDPLFSLEYDYTTIPALKDKIGDEQKFFLELYKNNACTRSELRGKSGLSPLKEDGTEDIFYKDVTPPQPSFGGAFRKTDIETYAKRARASWSDLRAIASSATPELQKEILRSLIKMKNGVDLSAMESALRKGNISDAMDAVPWDKFTTTMLPKAEQTFERVISRAALKGAQYVPGDYKFDVENPLATKWARSNAATMVTNVDKTTRDAIKESITKTLETKQDWKAAAKEIKQMVGMTSVQAGAIQKMIDKGASGEAIEKQITKYIKQRSEMIARTECIDAANRGQELAWEDAMDGGWLDPRTTKRRWITGPDPCELCEAMGESDPVGLDENFPGDVEGPTLHPHCTCAEGLVFE